MNIGDTMHCISDSEKVKRKPRKYDREASIRKARERMDDLDENSPEGAWMLFPRIVGYSRAYQELVKTSPMGVVFLIAMYDQLRWEPKPKKNHKGVPTRLGKSSFKDGGKFHLTNAQLHAFGISSPDTIQKVRTLVWELGFYDVVKPGSRNGMGTFKYSDRWRWYPNPKHKPVGQKPPGVSDGYGFKKKSGKIKLATISEARSATISEARSATSSAGQVVPSNNLNELPEPSPLRLSKHFIKLGGGVCEPSGTGDSHHNDERPTTPPHDSSRGVEIPREVDRAALEMGIPAKIIDAALSLGHECIGARHMKIDKEVFLQFSHRHTVKVAPTYYEHTNAEGKSTSVKELSHVFALLQGLDPKFILYPGTTQDATEPPTTEPSHAVLPPRFVEDTTDIEDVMERYGYGLCTGRAQEHGELCLVFADDVRLDVIPGSIRCTRPGKKGVRVKDAAGLEKRFARELADKALIPPPELTATAPGNELLM